MDPQVSTAVFTRYWEKRNCLSTLPYSRENPVLGGLLLYRKRALPALLEVVYLLTFLRFKARPPPSHIPSLLQVSRFVLRYVFVRLLSTKISKLARGCICFPTPFEIACAFHRLACLCGRTIEAQTLYFSWFARPDHTFQQSGYTLTRYHLKPRFSFSRPLSVRVRIYPPPSDGLILPSLLGVTSPLSHLYFNLYSVHYTLLVVSLLTPTCTDLRLVLH